MTQGRRPYSVIVHHPYVVIINREDDADAILEFLLSRPHLKAQIDAQEGEMAVELVRSSFHLVDERSAVAEELASVAYYRHEWGLNEHLAIKLAANDIQTKHLAYWYPDRLAEYLGITLEEAREIQRKIPPGVTGFFHTGP